MHLLLEHIHVHLYDGKLLVPWIKSDFNHFLLIGGHLYKSFPRWLTYRNGLPPPPPRPWYRCSSPLYMIVSPFCSLRIPFLSIYSYISQWFQCRYISFHFPWATWDALDVFAIVLSDIPASNHRMLLWSHTGSSRPLVPSDMSDERHVGIHGSSNIWGYID